MGEGNQTFVLEFTLLGLSQDPKIQILLFCVFLVIYLLSVFGNLLIIILIQTDPRLHTPMYFFLKNLSFVDLCFSTSIVPQMLVHFLVKKKTISFAGCSLQIVVFLLAGCTECALLAIMSYDRYVAVCRPLHYSTLMTQRVCVQLAIVSWISGAFVCLVDSAFTLCLPYQGQNIINHYFCEPPALLKLASADTYSAEMALFSMGVIVLLAPVSLILQCQGSRPTWGRGKARHKPELEKNSPECLLMSRDTRGKAGQCPWRPWSRARPIRPQM